MKHAADLRAHDYAFGPLDSLLRADRKRAEVSELRRVWRTSEPRIRPQVVYLPAPGVIARSLLYRSY